MNNFCTHCGNSNIYGNFCTKCGASVIANSGIQAQQNTQPQIISQQVGTGKLTMQRRGKFFGAAVNINIKINGAPYVLSSGQSISLDLAPGIYQISYDVWCRREKHITINILSGNEYLIDFVSDLFWGGFKVGKKSKLQ